MRQVWGYGIAGVALAVGAFALLQWNPVGANLENTGVRQYATGRGQRLTVTLSESSHVTLAPLSRIQYSETRSGHVTVVLDGQAVFDVAHSPDRTFTVQAGRVTTRVLGTTFDVRHYATDSVVQVAVLSGKVSSAGVTSGTTSGIIAAPTIVTPGHVLLLTDSTARPALRQSVDDIVAWKDGKLIFVKTPVAEALSALGKWYEYEFRLADSTLRDAKITTTLRVDDRQESLKALQDVLNVTMTFEGNVITLHPNRGARHVDTPVNRRRVAAINQGD